MAVTNPLIFLNILGQPVVSPSIASLWEIDETTQGRFVAQHDVILLGSFEGGPAGILAPYLDTREMQQMYDPENLHTLGTELIPYLKTPSGDANRRGAYKVYVLRLGSPTSAALILQNSTPANVATYTADDAGTYVNKISLEIGTGTIAGKRITRRFRDEVLVVDNLQNSFGLAYTGNASVATVTITRVADRATRLQTTLTGASDGSISVDLDLTGDSFSTVQQLVTYLNGQNGYRATIDPYGAPLLPTYELDAVSAVTIRTPVALQIRYVGAGSAATMTVTNTALTTAVTGASDNLNIDLTAASTDTLGELVAYIDGLSAYTCTLGANADANATCNALLNNVSAQDIRTSLYSLTAQAGKMKYVVQAGLGSLIYGLNAVDDRGSLTRWPGATTVPVNMAQTFLSGGTNPAVTIDAWLAGLAVIQQEDLGAGAILFPVTTDPVMQTAIAAWIVEQHTTHGQSFRAFFGTPDNTSVQAVKSLVLGFNSSAVSTVFQAGVSTASSATALIEVPPLYPAAMACGLAAGALPTQPITWAPLRLRGLPARAKLSKAVQEDLAANGVLTLQEDKSRGVLLGLAVTTSLSANRIDRMLSESMARDVIEQRVRAYVEPLIPRWAYLDFLAIVAAAVTNALQSLERERIISQGRDAQNRILRAYAPPQVRIQAGMLRITVSVKIGGEIDHVDVSGLIGYQLFELTITPGA